MRRIVTWEGKIVRELIFVFAMICLFATAVMLLSIADTFCNIVGGGIVVLIIYLSTKHYRKNLSL